MVRLTGIQRTGLPTPVSRRAARSAVRQAASSGAWRTISVPSGRQVRHRPSGCRSTRKPWWTLVWWRSHSSAEFSSDGLAAVESSAARWWTSHQWVGASQPANTQCSVPELDGPAQVRGDDPVGAAEVQRLPVGADDDPGDAAVAGQPAGAGGGDPGAEAGVWRRRGRCAGRRGRRGRCVTTTCGLTRAQDRQVARRRGRCRPSCTNASPSCWARVRVSPAGRAACTMDSSAACTFSPPTGVEVEAAGDAAVGVLGDRQRAGRSVGSGSGPSGSSRSR